jgi:SAM-dependent methyltransferase
MRRHEIETLDRLETSYWWHVGRREVIRTLIESFVQLPENARILDLGCGTGRNVKLLQAFGRAWGADPAPEAWRIAQSIGLRGRLVGAAAERLPFRSEALDLVSAFDVLEHLDDDVEGLEEIRRILRPQGVLVVAVPAYRFLWSEHDEVLGHRRRYVASELHQKLNAAGYSVDKRTYAITFAFPGILAYRLWRGLFPAKGGQKASYVMLPAWLNTLLARLLGLEARAMRAMDLPIGTSIFAIARRV